MTSSGKGPSAAASPDSHPPSRRKVMVVDDDPTVLEGVRAVLETAGYTVSVRAQALGSTLAIFRECPEIVILDVDMPELSGDVISTLLGKLRDQSLCVIFHSSRPKAELERIVRATGARGAIPKGDLRKFMAAFHALIPSELRVRY